MVLSPLKPPPCTVKMLPSLHRRIFLVPVSRAGRTNFCSWHLPPGKRFAEQSLILLTASPRDLSKTSGPTCIDWLLHALDGKKLWCSLAKTSLQAKAGTDYTNQIPVETTSVKWLWVTKNDTSWYQSLKGKKDTLGWKKKPHQTPPKPNPFVLSQQPDCFMTKRRRFVHSCLWMLAGESPASYHPHFAWRRAYKD